MPPQAGRGRGARGSIRQRRGGRTSITAPSWLTALRWCTATSLSRKVATAKTRGSGSPWVAVKVTTRSSTVAPRGNATRSEPVPAAALALALALGPTEVPHRVVPGRRSAYRLALLRSPFVGRHLSTAAGASGSRPRAPGTSSPAAACVCEHSLGPDRRPSDAWSVLAHPEGLLIEVAGRVPTRRPPSRGRVRRRATVARPVAARSVAS